jgi:hypothetical protein
MDPVATRIEKLMGRQMKIIEADERDFERIEAILNKDWSLNGLEEIQIVLTRRLKRMAK